MINYELATYCMAYALLILAVWAYCMVHENKLLKKEMDNLRKACRDLRVFAHTISYREDK